MHSLYVFGPYVTSHERFMTVCTRIWRRTGIYRQPNTRWGAHETFHAFWHVVQFQKSCHILEISTIHLGSTEVDTQIHLMWIPHGVICLDIPSQVHE
jgi:hypothetical protein